MVPGLDPRLNPPPPSPPSSLLQLTPVYYYSLSPFFLMFLVLPSLRKYHPIAAVFLFLSSDGLDTAPRPTTSHSGYLYLCFRSIKGFFVSFRSTLSTQQGLLLVHGIDVVESCTQVSCTRRSHKAASPHEVRVSVPGRLINYYISNLASTRTPE